MNRILKKLTTAQSKYEGAILEATKAIEGKVKFDFEILYQESDGFVLLCVDNHGNAPLSECLKIIKQKGELNIDDFQKQSI